MPDYDTSLCEKAARAIYDANYDGVEPAANPEARWLACKVGYLKAAGAALAAVREHLTSEASVRNAKVAWATSGGPTADDDMRAAIIAALGEEP